RKPAGARLLRPTSRGISLRPRPRRQQPRRPRARDPGRSASQEHAFGQEPRRQLGDVGRLSRASALGAHVMIRTMKFERRRWLRGLGGVAVGLPMLDIFEGRAKAAAPAAKKIYSALILQQNGLVQGPHTGGGEVTAVVPNAPVETDMFWPRAMGPLSAATM